MVRSKLILSLILTTLVLGCKKDKELVNKDESECREGLLPPPSIRTNPPEPFYGFPVTILAGASSNPSVGISKEVGTVLENPDGTKAANGAVYIKEFKPEDEQTYYAYLTYGKCRTEKVAFTVKGKVFTSPCTYPKNWINIKGYAGAENVSLTNLQSTTGSTKRFYTAEIPGGLKLTFTINRVVIEEGEYSLKSSLANSSIKEAAFNIDTSPGKYLYVYTSSKAYIVKNPVTGKMEATICGVQLRQNQSPYQQFETELNIVLD